MRFFKVQLALVAFICASASILTAGAKPVAESGERVITFPTSHSIGTLYAILPKEMNRKYKPLSAAFGTVKVTLPKSKWWMQLNLNKEPFFHPTDLDAVSDNIDVLVTEFIAMADEDVHRADAVVARLGRFKSLKGLDLDSCDASDSAVSAMGTLPQLWFLSASMSGITGKCFKDFPRLFPRLVSIRMNDNRPDQTSFQDLVGCKNLIALDFRGNNLDNEAIKNICKCVVVKKLNISNNPHVDDKCIKYLLSMKNLIELQVNGTHITLAGLQQLMPLHLNMLEVASSDYGPKDMQRLRQIAKVVNLRGPASVSSFDRHMFSPLH